MRRRERTAHRLVIDQPLNDGATDWTSPGAFEVSPGLYRIPLPLPSDGLRAVNVYALLDHAGVGLIDSGWAIPAARVQLEHALALVGRRLGDVNRILVTHVHRDHYTLGVLLRREFGSRVSLGAGERPSLDNLMKPAREREMASLDALRLNGAGEIIESIRKQLTTDASRTTAWELPDNWLQPGRIAVGGRTLDAIATPGHTIGHLVFHDAQSAQLFTGDHVLPTITPSIGFEAAPMANPLRAFMESLAAIRRLPDARLLPAHGPITDSVHARVDELVAHHGARLDATEAAVHAGATTPYEVARVLLWTRRLRSFADLDAFNQMLAVGETAAHLFLLVSQNRCTMTIEDGIRNFS
jgi:glyoxylase-like metal-dependent hydrolase (beta-lactamase superfamily II)